MSLCILPLHFIIFYTFAQPICYLSSGKWLRTITQVKGSFVQRIAEITLCLIWYNKGFHLILTDCSSISQPCHTLFLFIVTITWLNILYKSRNFVKIFILQILCQGKTCRRGSLVAAVKQNIDIPKIFIVLNWPTAFLRKNF